MKFLIFGASGQTGKLLTKQSLEKGHHVTAFVRTPEKLNIKHQNLEIIQGVVQDENAVQNVIKEDLDAVFSALGAKTPFQKAPDLIKGIKNIVDAMEGKSVNRLIYQSFLGVKENRKELGFITHYIMPIVMKNVIEDHEEKEKIITQSNLNWTILRASRLTNDSFTGNYRHGERILPESLFFEISRADVAHFMINMAEESQYIHKKPRIMY